MSMITFWVQMARHCQLLLNCLRVVTSMLPKERKREVLVMVETGAMTDETTLGIGSFCQDLNVLRLTLGDLIGDDKRVACAGGDGDEFHHMGINPFLLQVVSKPSCELRITSKVVDSNHSSEDKTLLLHAMSQCPKCRRTQCWAILLHHISLEKVDQDYVSLKAIPPEIADLLVIGKAQEGGEHSG